MQLTPLTAISPVDGRYWRVCEELASYFSEFALIRYRLKVEIEYLIALNHLEGFPLNKRFTPKDISGLRGIYKHFSEADALRIKEIEGVTNHDVKAVEYFIKEQFSDPGRSRLSDSLRQKLTPVLEFVHFGLTSQDINNTAVPMSMNDALGQYLLPLIKTLIDRLQILVREWEDVAMLARTHGQPASPTRLGKEIRVFVYRLEEQMRSLKSWKFSGKFGGATGNFNAHMAAYPGIDWADFADRFLKDSLKIRRETFTTQISNYDNLAEFFDTLRRINTIILDLDRDMWMYVSLNYFKQRIKKGEVGSSAMPHKVNPIDFENSEGNIGIANAILTHLAEKLPVSRLQRDLTDSTVLRNIGVPLAHSVIAIRSTLKGLDKLLLNRAAIDSDLEANWAVVAEGIQTILRREGYPHPYETLKQLTRTNTQITRESIAEFIAMLDVAEDVRKELLALSPTTYTGVNLCHAKK